MTDSTGRLHFDIDARHIIQLGMELVVDRSTAVAELVKNAYDADASEVEVRFERDQIVVTDDGDGMSLDDIRGLWMWISTGGKADAPVSPRFRRTRAGKKGIGRFAAQSLGSRLTLSTTKRRSTDTIVVDFEWDRDYSSGRRLADIGNPYEVTTTQVGSHGTTLTIGGLRHQWSHEDLLSINDSLTLLQPPFPISRESSKAQNDPGFDVHLFFEGERSELGISGREEFLASATATVTGRVTEGGRCSVRVRSKLLGLDDRQSHKVSEHLQGIKFRAFYYIYKATALGGISTRVAQQMGNKYGGIRIYRDGLRIPPYGDGRDDWLQLDALYRRRSVLYPIQNASWFGYVDISEVASGLLVDTASREGIVANEAYNSMRDLVHESLVWAAGRVASARSVKPKAGGKGQNQPPPAESRVEIVRNTQEKVQEALLLASKGEERKARAQLEKNFRDLRRTAKRADEVDRERQSDLVNEVELLRVLASLGTSIAVFSHEVRGALNVAASSLAQIEEAATEAGAARRDIEGSVAYASKDMARLQELANYIDLFISHGRRRQRTKLALYEVVESFVSAFQEMLSGHGVEIDWDVTPGNLRTRPMNRAELESILFNFLTNSIKALGEQGGRTEARRIRIGVERRGRTISLNFEDNGRGIDPSIKARIFDPFVTASFSREVDLGLGTGLGLKIVADIAEANGGTVSIAKPSRGYNTRFELLLPTDARSRN